jgi:hypothetical protein
MMASAAAACPHIRLRTFPTDLIRDGLGVAHRLVDMVITNRIVPIPDIVSECETVPDPGWGGGDAGLTASGRHALAHQRLGPESSGVVRKAFRVQARPTTPEPR